MRTTMLLGAMLCLAGVARADDDAAKKYLAGLEGTWQVASMKKAGQDLPAEFLKEFSVIIKGNALTLKAGKEEDKTATLVVDPAQKPVSIDMTPKDGPNAGKQVLGVISVDKDGVTMAWSDDKEGKTRPADFTSTKDNRNFVMVLRKPGAAK